MKLNIEINNTDNSPVKKTFIKKVIASTWQKSGYAGLNKNSLGLSFAWISNNEMQQLNKSYRKKDRATDVLSFCEYEDAEQLKNSIEPDLFLGELILCYDYIKELMGNRVSAQNLEKELARTIAHGVLHLLCFRHGRKMFAIQDVVSDEF